MNRYVRTDGVGLLLSTMSFFITTEEMEVKGYWEAKPRVMDKWE